ncbi:kinase-like protein [Schizopora paradoxa]|uniref:Kinase-like protein n=1 Tax=Schizopora paradoxa TaxID=27342 RepID=A0A0H2S1R3_9AGAM|nr:kinase-like protein [Schizopora paradoxa]
MGSTVSSRLDFLRMSADAMTYLHEMGVVHGDVNPSNILVKDDGTPAICDFGNSHLAGSQYTRTGPPVGTARYTPPEVISQDLEEINLEASDYKTLYYARDVWSFAMTGLELISGAVPYHHVDSDVFVLMRIVSGELPDHMHYETVPQCVWDILIRCWTRDPKGRPTMVELKNDMDNARKVLGSSPPPESIPEPVSS